MQALYKKYLTCIRMAEALCCPPKTTTTAKSVASILSNLLIHYNPNTIRINKPSAIPAFRAHSRIFLIISVSAKKPKTRGCRISQHTKRSFIFWTHPTIQQNACRYAPSALCRMLDNNRECYILSILGHILYDTHGKYSRSISFKVAARLREFCRFATPRIYLWTNQSDTISCRRFFAFSHRPPAREQKNQRQHHPSQKPP